MKTRIFLDSGSSIDTGEVLAILGYLDGQTTNPSLIAKSPGAAERLAMGKPFSQTELALFYQQTIEEVRAILPTGALSIEVYADADTSADDMIAQAEIMNTWTHDAYIKLPTTPAGLVAARSLVDRGMNVNMTLVFSESQAAAVYAATRGAQKGQVFLSPFIGRLDDIGQQGVSLIENIVALYKQGDGHVEILAASIRSIDHMYACLRAGVDCITAPKQILHDWHMAGDGIPGGFVYAPAHLEPILSKSLSLDDEIDSYDISHPLTEKGLQKFADDWNGLLEK